MSQPEQGGAIGAQRGPVGADDHFAAWARAHPVAAWYQWLLTSARAWSVTHAALEWIGWVDPPRHAWYRVVTPLFIGAAVAAAAVRRARRDA